MFNSHNWFELDLLFFPGWIRVCMQRNHFAMAWIQFLRAWSVITMTSERRIRQIFMWMGGHLFKWMCAVGWSQRKNQPAQNRFVPINVWAGDNHFSWYARRVTMILLLCSESFQLAVIMNIRCFEYMYAIIEHLLFAKSVHNRKKIHSTWEVERKKSVPRSSLYHSLWFKWVQVYEIDNQIHLNVLCRSAVHV